jgi:hypothetical protein
MREYTASVRPVAHLGEAERRAMVDLYLAHYDGSSESTVLEDLSAKTEALLLHHRGVLVGFSTLELYERDWTKGRLRVVYSGDTVVARAHWGQQALAFRWIARMGELHRERPDLPVYWLLIVKGHRTFKFLPAFGKSFFPHWSIDRSDLRPLAEALAREKFGATYNEATGCIEPPRSRGHMKPEIAHASPQERGKPAVRFFLERNPRYLEGHELLCLCEIHEANMRPMARRVFVRNAV